MPVVSTPIKKRPSNRASRAMRARSQIFASSSTMISLPLVFPSDSPFSDLNERSGSDCADAQRCFSRSGHRSRRSTSGVRQAFQMRRASNDAAQLGERSGFGLLPRDVKAFLADFPNGRIEAIPAARRVFFEDRPGGVVIAAARRPADEGESLGNGAAALRGGAPDPLEQQDALIGEAQVLRKRDPVLLALPCRGKKDHSKLLDRGSVGRSLRLAGEALNPVADAPGVQK